MRGISTAALAACVLFALVLVGGASAGGPGDGHGRQAAEAACKAKGLKPGSDAFKACLKAAKSGGGQGPSNPKERAAGEACKAQGLTPGSDAFKACMKAALGGGGGGQGPSNPKERAAGEACKAQGLTPGTDAFRACMKAALGGGDGNGTPPGDGNGRPPGGDQAARQAAEAACKAQGLQPGTDALKQCVASKLGNH